MTRHTALRTVFGGRAVLTTFAAVLILVALAVGVEFQPVQVPGYLVLVGFDLFQNRYLPSLGGTAFWSLFVGYCYALAVVLTLVRRCVQRATRHHQPSTSPPPR